ncbi:MarR family winged helix-turn-helix transcriptional regulator [Streptosporangium subroseum]|uniref:MarR family winged helix-turn-helix transcriptional regulator n=1 Tax=Streptosporangium subroseum TaxID=106412 RepID=UPI00344A0033
MAAEDTRVAAEGLDRIGFLLARHGAITDGRIRQALGVAGLTTRQSMTLMHLAQAGRMSQQALIEALGVDPSVLVAVLNDLERDGLAVRHRDPADRRRHIVEITPGGSEALTRVKHALAAVERELFADLDDDEIARLRELLARVRTAPDDPLCAGH